MALEALSEMYRVGRQRWPAIDVDFAAFTAYCERAIKPEWAEGARSHAAELYLCCGCALGNAQAAYALEREGAAVARSAIARIQRDPEFVQDTLQEQLTAVASGTGRGTRALGLGEVAINPVEPDHSLSHSRWHVPRSLALLSRKQ